MHQVNMILAASTWSSAARQSALFYNMKFAVTISNVQNVLHF